MSLSRIEVSPHVKQFLVMTLSFQVPQGQYLSGTTLFYLDSHKVGKQYNRPYTSYSWGSMGSPQVVQLADMILRGGGGKVLDFLILPFLDHLPGQYL
jgi:hypothetical protein